jgi:iron complex outermembrane receptor protein
MQTDISQDALDDRHVGNLFVLADWNRRFATGHGLKIQAYFDRSTRDQPGAIDDRLDTWDLEVHHALPALGRHEILWGAGYRYQDDDLDNLGTQFAFIPDDRVLEYTQVFAQDRIRLAHGLDLIGGIRFERNVYTQWEYLPNARLSWTPDSQRLIWAAWSRAVRAPARLDREVFSPSTPPFLLAGGPNFVSEIANVGEIGYRAHPGVISYSLTGFFHDFDRLRSLEPATGAPVFANGLEATVTGGEGWFSYHTQSWWELMAGWTELRVQPRTDPGVVALPGNPLGNDPNHWGTLRSEMDLGGLHEVDLWVRYVGSLPSPEVPAYASFNARYGVHLPHGIELSITGYDLIGAPHAEWGADPLRPVYGPSVFAQIRWEAWR